MFFHPKLRVEDFEAAAMPHFPDLYRTARLLAQDSAEAEDLVQEVYLEAWKSFHRFRNGNELPRVAVQDPFSSPASFSAALGEGGEGGGI